MIPTKSHEPIINRPFYGADGPRFAVFGLVVIVVAFVVGGLATIYFG